MRMRNEYYRYNAFDISYSHVEQEGDVDLITFQLREEDTVYKVNL